MTLPETASKVTDVAADTISAASEPTGSIAGRIGVAIAALVLPVLWGLIVHLIFQQIQPLLVGGILFILFICQR